VRVLVSQGAEHVGEALAERCVKLLAGGGPVVRLSRLGPFDFRRPLTCAEVHALRAALLGQELSRRQAVGVGEEAGGWRAAGAPDGIVGYVCGGRSTASARAALLAVDDHVNLTWRSPLAGANDDRLGPRFPALTGCYAPDVVEALLAADPEPAVARGIVAGVVDQERPTAFEREVAGNLGLVALSSELVSVVILAAHLGLRVAALVVSEVAYSR
jgi:hypothetical protein